MDLTYTIQLTEAQYAALLDRAAELEIPLEDLLLQAMQNFLEESDNCKNRHPSPICTQF